MTDIQALVDSIFEQGRQERQRHLLTLGQLIAALEPLDPALPVVLDPAYCSRLALDVDWSIENPHSYRGYYEDLAFEPTPVPQTVAKVLFAAQGALGNTYEGWKGGWFTMHEQTPVWVALQGDSDQTALVGVVPLPDKVILVTKRIEI